MFIMSFKMALNSIRAAKLRSFLTMFAVIIGVMAFIIVTTTVDGLKNTATSQINDLGGNLVTVNSGQLISKDSSGKEKVNFAASFGASTLTEKDYNDIKKIDGIKATAPQVLISGVVKHGDKTVGDAYIGATSTDYPKALNQKVEQGDFFSDSDTRFAVIGKGLADELFPNSSALGRIISIRGRDFTIVGVMETFESALNLGGLDINKAVLIPLGAAKKLTGGPVLINEIDIQVNDTSDVNEVVKQIESTLLGNHGGEHDFTVLKQDELVELTGNLLGTIKQASQFIAYIMLFVGAVVIMLIMLISVTERIKEIGIRKSIGATNLNILTQFLIEAVVLSWLGTALGLAFGWLAGFAVKALIDITPAYTLATFTVISLIATVIGVVAGIYPAMQAARKNPVEALRHE